MARMRTPDYLRRLVTALQTGLKRAGIRAEIETEPVQGTRLHRVYVVASKFRVLRPSERQDLVWRIAQQVLNPEEQLRVSMIMTLTRQELAGTAG